jgi:hypothetical protein
MKLGTLSFCVVLLVVKEALSWDGEVRRKLGWETNKYRDRHPGQGNTPAPHSSVELTVPIHKARHHGSSSSLSMRSKIAKAELEHTEDWMLDFDDKHPKVHSKMRLLNFLPRSLRWR